MKKPFRWILLDQNSQPIRSYQTTFSQGSIFWDIENNQLLLTSQTGDNADTSSLLEFDYANRPIRYLADFHHQKETLLANGFHFKSDQATTTLVAFKAPQDQEDEKLKPLPFYLKRSGIFHLATLALFILLTTLLKKEVEEMTPPPVVKLIQIEKPKPKVVSPTINKTLAKVTPQRSKKTKNTTTKASPQMGLLKALSRTQTSSQALRTRSASANPATTSAKSAYHVSAFGKQIAQAGGASLGSGATTGYKSAGLAAVQRGDVRFPSRGKALSALPEVGDDFGGAQGLDADQIIAVIQRHRGEVVYCYEQALKQDSQTRGQVGMSFRIGPNGLVQTARVSESTVQDPQLESCIASRLRSWKFPKPVGQVSVDVFYPFRLTRIGQN